MTDLMEFLRARLDEEAQKAEAACHGGPGRWLRSEDDSDNGAVMAEKPGSLWREIVIYDEGSPTPEQAAHIVTHDPGRVLAEVEAKRQIIDKCGWAIRTGGGTAFVRPVLKLLALPYSDHPDYEPDWAPTA